jgi:hypothetical protein
MDVESLITQDSLLPIDVANARFRGDDTFQTRATARAACHDFLSFLVDPFTVFDSDEIG